MMAPASNQTTLRGSDMAPGKQPEPPFDWSQRAFYLAGVVALLMFSALILLLICYYTREESDEETGEGSETLEKRPQLIDNNRSTRMASSLQKSAKDSDVILAHAMSSIPLRELGGKNNEIVVSVSQQMDLDRKQIQPMGHECVACKSMKQSTNSWKQVLCYAQTTIGVLVYKREQLTTKPGVKSNTLKANNERDSSGSSRQLAGIVVSPVSTLEIRPSVDSRQDVKVVSPSPARRQKATPTSNNGKNKQEA